MSRGKREAVGGGGWHREGDPFSEKTPKPKKDGKKESLPWRAWPRWKQGLVIAGGCVVVLAVVAAVAWSLLVKRPDVTENDRPIVSINNPNEELDEEGNPVNVSGRKEDYYTFLLIGRDTAGGGNTDTMILVSYDVPNGQVNMMSLPRDTAVNVPWSVKKLNSVYNAKESSGGGLDGLKKQVAYLTGVLPDFYVVIEWKAVGEIVEAVDGVEFDVPRNMNYDDDVQNLHIHLNKGLQTLNGKQAMSMLRYRNDNGYKAGYNDIGRMNTQRDFLKAMAKKVLQLGNITKIGDFIKIFLDNVETDLSLTDLTWFATKALSVDLDKMQSSTLPYIDVGYFHGGDYLLPNGEEIVPLVNEQFNPYNREITLNDLQILVRNKDGSCSVTSGELLATGWAKPTKSSTGTTGGGVTTTEPTGVVADPAAPSGGDKDSNDSNQSNDNSNNNNSNNNNNNSTPPTEPPGNEPDSGNDEPDTGTDPGTTPEPSDPEGPDEPDVPDDPGSGEEPGGADEPGGGEPEPPLDVPPETPDPSDEPPLEPGGYDEPELPPEGEGA